MKIIIADNIQRVDLTVKSMMRSSDGKEIPVPGTKDLTLLYDSSVLSAEEVEEMIKTNSFKNDKRVLILASVEANKLRTVFNVIEK